MIKAIDAEQGGPQLQPAQDFTDVAVPQTPLSPVEIIPLTRAEKRLLLAQMIRVNALDCFDDSGAFDLARAQRVLPPCAVQQIVIHETTRTDKQGNTTVQRRITPRLVDKIRAMRLDDLLEDREDMLHHRRPPTRAEFEASRKRKMAEEDGKARQREALMREDQEERRKEAEERTRQLRERHQDPDEVPTPGSESPIQNAATKNQTTTSAHIHTLPAPPGHPRT